MKTVKIILITFIVAMATTLLLDWSFIDSKIERRLLVGLLIITEIATGLLFFKQAISSIQKK